MKRMIVICVLLIFPSLAFSFPFRAVEPGAEIPSVELEKTDGGSFSVAPSKVKGKGLIVLFWAADSPVKKDRAIEIMEVLNDVAGDGNGIEALAINVGGDTPEVINEVVGQVNPGYPVLLDKDRKAYQAFGVFTTPSVLVVDGQGSVKTGFGYSRTIEDQITTEAMLLLGKITEQEAKEKMVPEVAETPEKEKKAKQHLLLGRRLENKGMPDKAKAEYAEAVELFDLAEAYIRLGVILLEEGDLEGAGPKIEKGLALDPDSLDAKVADARLRLAKGDAEGVLEELQMLSFRSPKNYSLRYAMGSAFEAKGDLKSAVKEYKKALELLRKQGAEE